MIGLRLSTPSLAALLLVGAALALSVWLYASRYPGLAHRRTALLLSVRALTLLALVFASLGPVLAYALASRAQNRLLVLVDRSGSMSVRDARGGRASRGEAADSAALSIASTLGGRYDVRIAAFDASLGPFRRPSDWRERGAGGPPGGETALGDALREMAQRVDPDSVAAVLVLSDGGVNRGEAPEQAPTNALPVYALSVGAATEPPTVGIAGIEAPEDVIVDRSAAIAVTVRQGSRGGTSGKARVLEGGRELGSASFALAGANASTRVSVPFTLGTPGKHFLSVLLDSVPGDPLRENKRRLVAVGARPPKRLFLLLASRWDWDLRSLARGVEEDSSWSVVRLRPSGAGDAAPQGGAPRPLATLLETADAVAARFDARVMTPQRFGALLRYVERGGGALLWVDPGTPPPNLPPGSSLGLTWDTPEQIGSVATIDLAPAGRGHELSLLGGDAATASAQWKSLPPVTVPFVAGTRGGPLEPLLVARIGVQTTPLLLAGRHGAGRVAVLDAAGVYRWGLTAAGLTSGPGIESAFFGGLRRWLSMSREERPVRVSAPDITPEGRSVPLRVTLTDTPEAGLAARVLARPLGPSGRGGEAALTAAAEGGYTGSIQLPPGVYQVLARVERGRRFVGEDSVRVAVGSQGIEYESLSAEPGTLERLAASTGGVAAPLSAPAPVLERLRSPDAARVRRAEVNLVQNPVLLLVIVLGAALEWTLRRRFHLL